MTGSKKAPNSSSNVEKPADETMQWEERLRQLHVQPKRDGDDWLRALYSAYLQQFLSDNNRIWTTGQLMVPLSLAPLAALVSIPGALCSWVKVLILAVPSVVLIWFWLVIAENHRAFQEKSRQWLSTIEKILNIEKPGGAKADGILVQPGRIRQVRWWLTWGITSIWFILFALSLCPNCEKWVPAQPQGAVINVSPTK